MFHSDFTEAQVIITCTRTIICNSCDKDVVSYDILNYGGNFYEQVDFGFSSSFIKKSPKIKYDTTKRKLLKLKSIQMLNIYEQ